MDWIAEWRRDDSILANNFNILAIMLGDNLTGRLRWPDEIEGLFHDLIKYDWPNDRHMGEWTKPTDS
jgi:hypothetical protein